MTTQIADFYALTSSSMPEKLHGADLDCAIRPGWLFGIGWGRIKEFRTLLQRERPNGFYHGFLLEPSVFSQAPREGPGDKRG